MYASNNLSMLKYSNNPGISNSPSIYFQRKQQAIPQLQYKNQMGQKGRIEEKKLPCLYTHLEAQRAERESN